MSRVETLRVFVTQRLTTAAEEIFGLFERTIAEYEEQLCRFKEEQTRKQELQDHVLNPPLLSHRADLQQLSGKEEDPSEQQEWSSTLDQGGIKPPHIKEEEEELWSSQDGLEEVFTTKFPFTSVPVKTEDDGDKTQSSQLHELQTALMETGADGEDCGGPQPARKSDPKKDLQTEIEIKTEDSYEVELEISDDWREMREHQTGFNSLEGYDAERSDSDKTSHSSSECSATVKTNQDLRQDMRINKREKYFSCSECGKRFKFKSNLIQHTFVHTGEKPFSCTECGKRFNQRYNLSRHMLSHTEEKPFSCSECDRKFSRKGCLLTHMNIHKDKKPFSCSNCGKRFYSRTHLNSHMIVHTGEKPFSCSVCNKRFNQKSNMTTHMVIHSAEKPFSCSECDKRFNQKSHLLSHMLVHTKEKRYRCKVCGQRFSQSIEVKRHECPGKQASENETTTNEAVSVT
ncbi:gastrula zinc finger protein XlCGF57.1-like [Cheilinus undulatus]|uniref:gastrula zinc finger protein XlCGF57.1-like n=1 Tax=Cheilinus undulatus TaxID=241271 RepID=UPI001BD4E903|nr:gastrula zinc finger protein XlCGF57.1-like [Cheilinus undulatus]